MTESVTRIGSELSEKTTVIWKLKGWSQENKCWNNSKNAECVVKIGAESTTASMENGPSADVRFRVKFGKCILVGPPPGLSGARRRIYTDLHAREEFNVDNQILGYQFEVSLVDEQLNEIEGTIRNHGVSRYVPRELQDYNRLISRCLGYFEDERPLQPASIRIKLSVTSFFRSDIQAAPVQAPAAEGASLRLNQALDNMFAPGQRYADIINLETRDGERFSACQLLLAARSPVLRDLIGRELDMPGSNGIVKLVDVNARPMEVILHWIYTGELLGIAGECMGGVLEAGIKFELIGFLDTLDKEMITVCNSQNMFLLHQIALKNGLRTAVVELSRFIRDN